jgi:hypothetical protein
MLRVTLIVVGGLVLTGCPPLETKVPSSTTISVPGEGILNGSPLAPEQAFPADVIGEALAQSVSQSIDTSGQEKGAVKSLKMTSLKLTVLDPSPQGVQIKDLGFLNSLAVSVAAPGGEPVLCAQSEPGDFDDPAPIEYDVPLTGNELADVLKSADTLELVADVEPAEPPQFATDVQVDSEMTIQFGL